MQGFDFTKEYFHLFQTEDDAEMMKIHQRVLRIVFSRTTGLNAIRLGTNPSWNNVIQVCSNEGHSLFQEITKIH